MGRRFPGDEKHGDQHRGADPRRAGTVDRRAVRVPARKRRGVLSPGRSGGDVPYAGRQIRYGVLFRHVRFGQILAGGPLPARDRPEPETDRRGVGQIRPPRVVSGVVSLAGDQPPDQEHVAHLCGSGPPCQGGFGRSENDDFTLHLRRQDRSGDGGRQGPFGRRAPPRVERDTGQCRRSGGHPRVSGRAGRLPRVVRLSGGEQGAGRQVRHGVLDQHRVVRPRHADPLPADQVGEAAAEAGRRTAGRDAERHHVRILALHESQFGLSAGGTSLRSLLRLF